nr:M23 family metallopeptidase [Actinomycetales bacterium]
MPTVLSRWLMRSRPGGRPLHHARKMRPPAQLRAALAAVLLLPLASTPPGDFSWPTGSPAPVIAPFAPPPVPWASGHRGVDLAFVEGGAVLAAGAGTVVFAGQLAGRGVVSIEHTGGLRTTYEPLEPAVQRGDTVAGGQVIGRLVAGHCAEPCLHLGARTGPEQYIDPLGLFAERRLRLLPAGSLGLRLSDVPA